MEIKRDNEQIIDTVTSDTLIAWWFSQEAREKAESLIQSFRTFIEENHEELALIKAYYSESYRSRVRLEDVKEFTKSLERHREFWGLRRLWEAFKILSPLQVTEESELKDTDTIPLITFTLSQIDRLEPYRYTISTKYDEWIASQASKNISYTPEQLEWLELMRDQIASSLSIQREDFEYDRFAQKGWLGGVYGVFGNRLDSVMEEMNSVLV
jgi:type I restriction enzyme R subunit